MTIKKRKKERTQIGKIINQFQVKFLYKVLNLYRGAFYFVLVFIWIFTLSSVCVCGCGCVCVRAHVHACKDISVYMFSIYLLFSCLFVLILFLNFT